VLVLGALLVAAGIDDDGALIFATGLFDCFEQAIATTNATAITIPAQITGRYTLCQLSPSICLKF
jgi:hypothetical protein